MLIIAAVQIAESFRRFGITPTTTSLLIIKVSNPSVTAASFSDHLSASVQGMPVAFEDVEIAKLSDLPRVKKLYKLNNIPSVGRKSNAAVNDARNGGKEQHELETLILASMALRGVN